MKKVLLLAYDFPPYVSVGGLRPFSWYKNFKDFGIYPIVITRNWNNTFGDERDYILESPDKSNKIEETKFGTIIKTYYKPNLANRLFIKHGNNKYVFIRKLISMFYEFSQFILPIGPKINLYKEADNYLKKNKVDYIIATASPFILFQYARLLGKKHNIPYLLDYRDLWSQNSLYKNNRYIRSFYLFFERKCLIQAKAVITVSPHLAREIKKNSPLTQFIISSNGYDTEIYDSIKPAQEKTKKFKIAYAGTLYPWHPLKSFLKTVNELVSERNDFQLEITFIGINNMKIIENLINNYVNIKDKVLFYNKMSNSETVKLLNEQNLLLLFNDYAYMGTKIYDYLAAKTNILFCYSDDWEANILRNKYFTFERNSEIDDKLQQTLIANTNSGYIITNEKELSQQLNKLYDEWKRFGILTCNSTNIELYSRANQIKSLSNEIKSLL